MQVKFIFNSEKTACTQIIHDEKTQQKEFKDMDDFEKFEIINEISDFFLQDEITEKNLSEIAKIPI